MLIMPPNQNQLVIPEVDRLEAAYLKIQATLSPVQVTMVESGNPGCAMFPKLRAARNAYCAWQDAKCAADIVGPSKLLLPKSYG